MEAKKQEQLADATRRLRSLPGPSKRPPVVVPGGRFCVSDRLIAFVEEARDWPYPMQEDLLPVLMANGFRTQSQQDESMKSALLRAAALDTMMTERQRNDYAKRYGRPKAIRLVWWVRRTLDRGRYDG